MRERETAEIEAALRKETESESSMSWTRRPKPVSRRPSSGRLGDPEE